MSSQFSRQPSKSVKSIRKPLWIPKEHHKSSSTLKIPNPPFFVRAIKHNTSLKIKSFEFNFNQWARAWNWTIKKETKSFIYLLHKCRKGRNRMCGKKCRKLHVPPLALFYDYWVLCWWPSLLLCLEYDCEGKHENFHFFS